MIRRPTPKAEVYRWHTAALAGQSPASHPDEPQAGWYKRRLVKLGPYVPARIWLDQEIDGDGDLLADERFYCEVAGEWRDPETEWLWLCDNPITEAEFNYMVARRDWAAANDALDPHSAPRQPVDWLSMSIQF